MKEVICNFNTFELHQNVYVIDTDNDNIKHYAITTLEDLPTTLLQACDTENIYNIHIYGNQSYAEGIKSNILSTLKGNLKFTKQNLNIEVN